MTTTSVLFRLGHAAARRPFLPLALWALALAAALVLSATVGTRFADSVAVPGTGSQRAADVLAAHFPAHGAEAVVVLAARDGAPDPAAVAGVLDRVRAAPHVAFVEPPAPSPDGRAVLAHVTFDAPAAQLKATADALAALGAPGLDVAVGGEAIAVNQQPEPGPAELIGLGVALLILLFSFGSVGAAALPIGLALVSVVIGVIAVGLTGQWLDVDVSSAAPLLAGMLGLGAGIDYALFLVTRAREELAAGRTVPDAVGIAVDTAGRAVLFAGLSVVVAIAGLALSGVALIAALGFAAAAVVLTSMLAALTLLPALLGLLGRRIDALRVPVLGGDGRVFAALAHVVARRPWRFGVGGVAVLVALAAPALDLRLGFPDDGAQPDGSSARRAYDLIAAHWGAGMNGPIVTVVEGEGADEVARVIAADPEVALVAPPAASADGLAHVVVAFPRHAPQDPAVAALVHRLRAANPGAHVGGLTAMTMDIAEVIGARLPLVIGCVLLVTFALLLVVFRSVLVPLKAVLLNLLSVGAAYGVLVVVFQWGYGRSFLGVDHEIPIVSILPMLLFAVLFGLSMDYEVFLLSRVREEHERGASTTASVATALASTGRVISSAALIMVTVFVAFAFGPDPMVKMFGIGLAAAIFVDATVVRLVLVPAFMVLLGEANWWFPGAGRRAAHAAT